MNLHSPDVFHHGQFHLAYANQIAQATSPITGGLICPVPVTSACPLNIPPGLSPVDHDQRNTPERWLRRHPPRQDHRLDERLLRVPASSTVLDGTPQSQYPGAYLPSHTTFDLAVGKTFAKQNTPFR